MKDDIKVINQVIRQVRRFKTFKVYSHIGLGLHNEQIIKKECESLLFNHPEFLNQLSNICLRDRNDMLWENISKNEGFDQYYNGYIKRLKKVISLLKAYRSTFKTETHWKENLSLLIGLIGIALTIYFAIK